MFQILFECLSQNEFQHQDGDETISSQPFDTNSATDTTPLLADSENQNPITSSSCSITVETEKRKTKKTYFVVGCILMTELCERMTFYSVMANMLLFCTSRLKYSNDEASLVTLIFGGKISIAK